MTEETIITGVLEREGGDQFTDRATDNGGPTKYGVTAATLGAYRALGRPATRAEVQALTEEEAREIYRKRFIIAPGFVSANVAFEPLRVQLIDFGVNSGPARAVRWLQRVLQVPVSGVLDGQTIRALQAAQPHLVNDALVAARLYMIDSATDDGSIHKSNEEGLESRALQFCLARTRVN
jgi:lysozyme family protein